MKYLIVPLLCFASCVQAQTNVSLKLYSQFTHAESSRVSGTVTDSTVRSNLSLSPALSWYSNNAYTQEIALTHFTFNRNDEVSTVETSNGSLPVAGAVTNTMDFGLRYEFIGNLPVLKKENNFSLRIGGAVSPRVSVVAVNPVISNSFPTRESVYATTIALVPRVAYNLNDQWFLDLNTVVNVVDFTSVVSRIENLALGVSDRVTKERQVSLFPKMWELRFGIGFKI
ncbi:MAG: hypothetical protein HOI49_05770 [Bacteroidetes bacterium]|jgi:hypothetical protein|nr:hypothetical protein [Bacteroidota bacterium]